jgi:hypothetical protein
MPFAQSLEAQTECWLRALRRSGDAGIVLMSLETSDDSSETAAKLAVEGHATPRLGIDGDVVATVVRHARLITDVHKHRKIRTNDLLAAVMNVYGATFDRVLARHGININDLIKQLGLSPRAGECNT